MDDRTPPSEVTFVPEPHLLAAAQALQEGMVLLDGGWRVVAANDAAGTILDVPTHRLEGSVLFELDPPVRDADGVPVDHRHPALDALRRDQPTAELRLQVGRDDEPTWVDARFVPIETSDTDGPAAVLSLRDVTESVHAAAARRQVEERLRLQGQLLEAVGQAVLAIDSHGVVVHWNAAAEDLYGWSADEVVGNPIDAIATQVMDVATPADEERRRALRRGESWSGEVDRRRRDGTPFVAMVTDSPFFDEDGNAAGVITVATDITDRIDAERQARTLAAQHAAVAGVGELAISEPDLQAVYTQSCELVAEVFDADVVSLLLRKDEGVDELTLVAGVGFPDGRVGSHVVPLGPRSWAGFTIDRAEPVIVDDLASEERFVPPWLLVELGVTTGIATPVHSDERAVGVLCAYRRAPAPFDSDAANALQSIANVIARAIERDSIRLTLSSLALTDQLTGLPNRALFLDRLQHLLGHRDRRGAAVLFLDLDDFKDVNDALGHDAGDEVLRVVGRRLRELCRGSDTVARFGGDEFAVLSEDVDDPDTAIQLGERLIRGVSEQPVVVGGREFRIGMSIGVAMADDGSEPSALLQDADMAMYRAKGGGGSRVRLFDERMRLSAVERVTLATDLRRSVELGQLVVHYQPEIELQGSTVWAEALVRWDHPERGMLTPGHFIEVAEETGFVIELGRWVLGEAIAQMARWESGEGPSSVSVNLSTWQLVDGDIVHLTADLLDEHGIHPSCLYFELTETALLREPAESLAALEAIKELGVGLAIDDFGTGYSSLSYVRTLPVDAVKIDRTFVQGIGVDRRDDGIVDAIIALARSFGILTIAEGVETEEQLELLTRLGCDFVQGYLIAPPAPAHELDAWFAQRS